MAEDTGLDGFVPACTSATIFAARRHFIGAALAQALNPSSVKLSFFPFNRHPMRFATGAIQSDVGELVEYG